MAKYQIVVNSKKHQVNVDSDTPILWVIRDEIGFKGTKFGCGMGLCGACTILLNGQPIRSCSTPIATLKSSDKIVTIEGLSPDTTHPVQEAWIAAQVPQCGYCQSGQILSASALLATNSNPTDTEIDQAMAGNICRCGTYPKLREAIHAAAKNMSNKKA